MAKTSKPLSLRERVEAVINRVRPYIQADGGDVEIAHLNEEDGLLFLRLRGACSGCPSAQITLQRGIENEVRIEVPEIKQVLSV